MSALLDVNWIRSGGEHNPTCYLLAPPVQLYVVSVREVGVFDQLALPDAVSRAGQQAHARLVYLDNINCGSGHWQVASVGLQDRYMRLVHSSAKQLFTYRVCIKFHSSAELCAAACKTAARCELAAFEIIAGNCYLIDKDTVPKIRQACPWSLTNGKRKEATMRTYCTYCCMIEGFQRSEEGASPERCTYKSLSNINVDRLIESDPAAIAKLVDAKLTADACAAQCFADSRCQSVIFAQTPDSRLVGSSFEGFRRIFRAASAFFSATVSRTS
ncbi:unnamed protein product [Sphagnum balticum]